MYLLNKLHRRESVFRSWQSLTYSHLLWNPCSQEPVTERGECSPGPLTPCSVLPILTLSSHVRVGLPSCLFPWGFWLLFNVHLLPSTSRYEAPHVQVSPATFDFRSYVTNISLISVLTSCAFKLFGTTTETFIISFRYQFCSKRSMWWRNTNAIREAVVQLPHCHISLYETLWCSCSAHCSTVRNFVAGPVFVPIVHHWGTFYS